MSKPCESANVRYILDEAGEITASDRRKFIQEVGFAVLTVQCLPLIAHATANRPIEGKKAADNLTIQSGPGLFQHVHDLLIPYVLLKAPPLQGVQLTTTEAMFHRHSIGLTQKELIIVNQGGTVTQKASSHHFVIALAKKHR